MRRMPDGTTRAIVKAGRHQVDAGGVLGARTGRRPEHDHRLAADRPMSADARLRALRGVAQRYRTDRRLFESMVAEALDDLPESFRERMSNVAVVVEDWPPDESDAEIDVDEGTDLLGLYQGIPLGHRSTGYHL